MQGPPATTRSDGWQYVPELEQDLSEPVAHKRYGDSFEETDLEAVLADRKVGRLVVAGAQTDGCILATLHGAIVRGYDATLVRDAHTTEDFSEYGVATPDKVILPTNLYWEHFIAPGRRAGAADTEVAGHRGSPLPNRASTPIRARSDVNDLAHIVGISKTAYVLTTPRRPPWTCGWGESGVSVINGWHGWVGTFTGVAVITVAVLPLVALAVWALARWRIVSGTTSAWAWRATLAEVGIVYGTVPWVWMTMLPGSRAGVVPGRVSLVPLRDLLTMSAGQVVGNLLVFAALGFLVPLRFAAMTSVSRILTVAAGCSVLVEAAQYVLGLDRVSSVDDVLLNTAGAGLAALASRRWWRTTARGSSERRRSAPVPGR